ILRGVTLYPFENKWTGLDAWRDGLGALVAFASVVGLAALAFVPAGRVVLLVAFTSLLPFSLTWRVDPNPRFTLHLYPFFLIAASIAGSFAVRAVGRLLAAGIVAEPAPWRRDGEILAGRNLATGAAVVAGSAALLWYVMSWSPQLVFADALRYRDDATVTVGDDIGFLGTGWSRPLDLGNVQMRIATGESGIRVRLPLQDDYRLTLRLDPFPRPLSATPARLPVIEYSLNGTRLGAIPLKWNPERFGAYEVTLPRSAVHPGMNTLVLRRVPDPGAAGSSVPGFSDGDAFAFWLLRASRPPG